MRDCFRDARALLSGWGEVLLTLLTSPQLHGFLALRKRLPTKELRRFEGEEHAQKISRGQL